MNNKIMFIIIAGLFVWAFACTSPGDSSQNETGSVQFSLGSGLGESMLGAAPSLDDVTDIVITVKDSNGIAVLNAQKLPVFQLGSSFVTNSVELGVGTYSVSLFFVVDAENNVLYASPLKGSPLALVVGYENALPIEFTVTADTTTQVAPAVLPVEQPDTPPSDFGYVTFSFNVIEITSLKDIRISVNNPGVDGNWFTGDDTKYEYRLRYTYDESYELVYFNGSGLDGIWFSSDDSISSWNRYYRDASGKTIREVNYTNAGADGIWRTADDVINYYYDYIYNTSGQRIAKIRRVCTVQGVFDPSDTITRIYNYDIVSATFMVEFIYSNSGADGIWETADDGIYTYVNHVYNAQGKEISATSWDTGVDNIPQNSDDVITTWDAYEYNTDGKTSKETHYDSHGTESQLDDTILYGRTYTYF